MNAYVPHGEVTIEDEGIPATFFVTESRDIKGEVVDRAGYTWDVTAG